MSKAINWPEAFRQEITGEPTDSVFCAFRPGTLYFEGHYWVGDEIVDIRCNHLKLRQGKIIGDMQSMTLKDVPDELWVKQKKNLQSLEAMLPYMRETFTHYDEPIDENTLISIVQYQNLPLDAEYMEAVRDTSGRHL